MLKLSLMLQRIRAVEDLQKRNMFSNEHQIYVLLKVFRKEIKEEQQ